MYFDMKFDHKGILTIILFSILVYKNAMVLLELSTYKFHDFTFDFFPQVTYS